MCDGQPFYASTLSVKRGRSRDRYASGKTVQDGDAGAFAELHARTHHRLRRAVRPVVSLHHLADDVVQDTYLHIWLKRHQYRPDRGSVLGWMTTIARRRAIDRVRTVHRAETAQTRYTTDPLGQLLATTRPPSPMRFTPPPSSVGR